MRTLREVDTVPRIEPIEPKFHLDVLTPEQSRRLKDPGTLPAEPNRVIIRDMETGEVTVLEPETGSAPDGGPIDQLVEALRDPLLERF